MLTNVDTAAAKSAPADSGLKQTDIAAMIQGILSMAASGAFKAPASPETAPVVLEAETPTEAVQEEKPKGPLFTLQPVLNSAPRIVIEDNDLREFFVHDTNLGIFGYNVLEESDDSAAAKLTRRRLATVDIPVFFQHIDEMKSYREENFEHNCSDLTYAQFQEFLAVVTDHYDTYFRKVKEEFESGSVSYGNLILYMNTYKSYAVLRQDKTEVFGKVQHVKAHRTMFGNYLEIVYEVYFHSHQGLNPGKASAYIMEYSGAKSLEEIGVRTVKNEGPEFRKFVARGERYLALTTDPSYVQCQGEVVYKSYWGPKRYNANGRFVIDFRGMKRADSNYNRYFGYEDGSRSFGGGEKTQVQGMDLQKASDEIKAACVPFVYGFSLKAKQWGEVSIDQISDISFRKDAYDKLVLDKDLKELIFAQVEDKNPQKEADLIDGKGGGCIFLLAGTPGLGKTLTAEAVAEKLQRPLYTVSVGELGTSVSELEENLRDILETATEWNAILLIDEADIFLEARTDSDIERNAMVAVFLRLLEYYQGILFLTTNRAANLDDAFFSRISLAIHYPKLQFSDRKKIWTNLLQASKIETFAIDIDQLAQHDLNGRQIKHVIKTAGAMARFKGRKIAYEDFQTIIGKQNEFRDYVDALNSQDNVIDGDKLIKEVPIEVEAEFKEVVVPKQGYFRRLTSAIFGK